MRYVNPLDGGWAMPTMATMIRLLPRGFATLPYRSSDGMVFVVVEGTASSTSRQRFDFEPHDVLVVPGWMRLHAARRRRPSCCSRIPIASRRKSSGSFASSVLDAASC